MSTSEQQNQVEQEEQLKYQCQFCNKRFSTGRALGGHMRAHGMYNEPIRRRPDEGPSTTTGAEGESSDGRSRPPVPICEDCREEFASLKSLSKHCCRGRGDNGEEEENSLRGITEEEHLAKCLVFLSSAARANSPVLRNAECSASVLRTTDAADQECSTSGRKELVDHFVVPPPSPQPEPQRTPKIHKCQSCQRVFSSHQALGGHRASHKKVRGCFANRLENPKPAKKAKYTSIEDESNNGNQAGPSSENLALAIVPFGETSSKLELPMKKPKVHECSICYRQFPSGQALGGHKRCHWSAPSSRAPPSVVATEIQVLQPDSVTVGGSSIYTPDLNMPEPMDDFPPLTLWVDMYVEPGREQVRENAALNVNIDEAESREVRSVTDLSELIDVNEREGGSKWLQIGLGSTSDQENKDDQP